MLTHLATIAALIQPAAGLLAAAVGVWYLWRGLWGTQHTGALLRRRATALQRMEGFRTATFGLVMVGLGLGWLTGSLLLTMLALGIGIAELRESTLIIDAVKRGAADRHSRSSPA